MSNEETMNLMEVSLDKICNEIEMELEEENYGPAIILGPSGVGKTVSIYELTQKLGIGFLEARPVHETELDAHGLPFIVDNKDGTKMTDYASSASLPNAERDGETGLFVLDEITSASRTVRAAYYQLMDSKRAIGNYKLPPKWKVVALGNGPGDGGVFTGMESAFLTRATGCCFRVMPTLTAFKKWGVAKGINPVVFAFLDQNPDYLHKMDPDEIASLFPCPRVWEALSRTMTLREGRVSNGILDREQMEMLASGLLGLEAGIKFATFYTFKKDAIDVNKILDGTDDTDLSSVSSEVVHIAIQSVVKVVNSIFNKKDVSEYSLEEKIKGYNAINWAIKLSDYRTDYGVILIRDLVAANGSFESFAINAPFDEVDKYCPKFDDFCGMIASVKSR